MKQKITAEELREILEYSPDTGDFRWKVRLSQGTRVGDIAGAVGTTGYLLIGIRRNRYYGHRLAWLYVHGQWPHGEIDHRDGDRANNRISNLRITDRSVNMQNVTRVDKNSRSGLLGVHIGKSGRISSRIMLRRKTINLGNFDSPEDAHEAYLQAKRKIHEGNTL